jgi:very-short-patch-repair endonuclease
MAKKKLSSIIKAYEDLINPENIIKHFKTDKEFKDWARDGTIRDIEYTLIRFEEAELYEHCKLLLEVIKEKENWNIKKKKKRK